MRLCSLDGKPVHSSISGPLFCFLHAKRHLNFLLCSCVQVGRCMCSGHAADASLCGRGVRALHGRLPQTNLPEQVSLNALRHISIISLRTSKHERRETSVKQLSQDK